MMDIENNILLIRKIAQEAERLSTYPGYYPGSATALAFSTRIEESMYRIANFVAEG